MEGVRCHVSRARETGTVRRRARVGRRFAYEGMTTTSTTVAGWMHRDVHTAHPHESIERARQRCEQHRVNQLPVVADGVLVGIVTDRDLRDAFPSVEEEALHPNAAHRRTAAMRVEDVMTANVLTILPGESVARAATVMRSERIGALPVVDGKRLVGIVTRTDLLNALVALTATAGDAG